VLFRSIAGLLGPGALGGEVEGKQHCEVQEQEFPRTRYRVVHLGEFLFNLFMPG
jgi:hypothetical protein